MTQLTHHIRRGGIPCFGNDSLLAARFSLSGRWPSRHPMLPRHNTAAAATAAAFTPVASALAASTATPVAAFTTARITVAIATITRTRAHGATIITRTKTTGAITPTTGGTGRTHTPILITDGTGPIPLTTTRGITAHTDIWPPQIPKAVLSSSRL